MLISWNVRGLNKTGKLREISSHLFNLQPEICILLETRVKKAKAVQIRNKINIHDRYIDNYNQHDNGRIWVSWNSRTIDINLECCTDQHIHCRVQSIDGKMKFNMTVVYALNQLDRRKQLWKDIEQIATFNEPWCIIGDYNNVLNSKDRLGGRLVSEKEYKDLQGMMEACNLAEMDNLGDYFTWHNKQEKDPIYSRIDRVLGNPAWFQNIKMYLQHLPASVSDHAILQLVKQGQQKPRRSKFKFINCTVEIEGFKEAVARSWAEPIIGSPPYILWEKLKRMRPVIRKISKPITDVKRNILEARRDLQKLQLNLATDHLNNTIIQQVKEKTNELIRWQELEEKVLQQKSKVDWIRLGDGNNQFFHASLKTRNRMNSMMQVAKSDGTILTRHAEIEEEILSYYGDIMGKENREMKHIDICAMREGKQVNEQQRQELTEPIQEIEIFNALHDIGDLKAPGLDGYNAKFFKHCWDIVKPDLSNTIKYWFRTSTMFKGFNSTIVTLIPKTPAAKYIKDYRPIACCSTVYKIYSKILTNRLAKVIGSIINHSQAAFIPGQNIHKHILLAYELIKGYSRKNGTPRCLFQIDLQKAYDMLNWRALEKIMLEIGIPTTFVQWIMNGVTTVSYRYNINGKHSKLMKAARGIRQGDPISPFLFVIVMEYMNRLLYKMQNMANYKHHPKCKKMELTHLTFADDILLFTRGEKKSVEAMMQPMHTFSEATGLVMNPSKCNVYMGAVDDNTKKQILEMTGFKQGTLPFRYLGVPLSCKRLSVSYYLPLVEKILNRIHHWSAKVLSQAGRIQLVQTVSFAIANYWLQCFPIPKAILHKLNTACRSFVWSNSTSPSRKSPIAWQTVCKPKNKGGMNVIDLECWNSITLMKHLWDLSLKTDSLWVKWMHMYFIKGQMLSNMEVHNSSSWIFKRIMKVRQDITKVQNCWNISMQERKFKMRWFYRTLMNQNENTDWSVLMTRNIARPRAIFCLWMACHRRLATRDRLIKVGVNIDSHCCLCQNEENIDHLLFACRDMDYIWMTVLKWIGVVRKP